MNAIIILLALLLLLFAAIALKLFIRLRRRGDTADTLTKNDFENFSQQANDALLVIDIVNGKIYSANPKLSELLGYPPEKLLELTVFDLHPKEMLARSSEVIADVWEKKGMIYSDIPFVSARGEILPVECSAKIIPFNDRPAILIFARDIRDRLRMEKDIREKNKIIEEKNKDITDSINYAKRIQQAILSDKTEVKKHLPESFIYFRPKDIVSGDFYWFAHRDGTTFIAAADCTGHGVPGAFMSMIANSFLNEVVNEKGILRPDLILNELREKVIRALRQTGEGMENRDGLDISLCAVKGNNLEFAGANNPAWIVRGIDHASGPDSEELVKSSKHRLLELSPCKQPIGTHPNPRPFSLRSMDLMKGDTVYLFSDGFADQFGGPKGKKIMYRNFADILLSIQDKKMEDHKNVLDGAIMSWKGPLEQVDDILVIGFRP